MKSCLVDIHTHSAEESPHICTYNLLVMPGEEIGPPNNVYFSCGFHPWHLSQPFNQKQHSQQLETLASHANCLALGEAGLDKRTHTPWDIQLEYFEMQVDLSERIQKPLIIHCVKAYDEVLAIRKNYTCKQVWILHGFSSSAQMAKQLNRAGVLISFGHQLLSAATQLKPLIENLPAESFFLETDDNDFLIEQIYNAAAQLRGEKTEKLAADLYANFVRIFMLPEKNNCNDVF